MAPAAVLIFYQKWHPLDSNHLMADRLSFHKLNLTQLSSPATEIRLKTQIQDGGHQRWDISPH